MTPEPSHDLILTDDLTEAEQRFVREYLANPVAGTAALRAGLASTLSSGFTMGHRILKKPQVRQVIEQAQAARAAFLEVEAARILRESANLAFADVRDVLTWDDRGVVRFRPSEDLTPDVAAAIKSIQVDEEERADGGVARRIKMQFHDKRGALDLLCRMQGLYQKERTPSVEEPAGRKVNLKALTDTELETLRSLQAKAQGVVTVHADPPITEEEPHGAHSEPAPDPHPTGELRDDGDGDDAVASPAA